KEFGAFIEIMPGRDGLCHISELSDGYVSRVEDVCKVGDVLRVKVISIDDQDRVKLSRKVLLREENPDAAAAEAAAHPRRERSEEDGAQRDRGGERRGNGERRGGGRGRSEGERR